MCSAAIFGGGQAAKRASSVLNSEAEWSARGSRSERSSLLEQPPVFRPRNTDFGELRHFPAPPQVTPPIFDCSRRFSEPIPGSQCYAGNEGSFGVRVQLNKDVPPPLAPPSRLSSLRAEIQELDEMRQSDLIDADEYSKLRASVLSRF